MPALVNYTPRFWTCPSRLLLTRLSLFSRCPSSYANPFFTGLFSLSLAFFLSPFNKLLARLPGFIVFPLDAALFIPHSPRIRRGCAGALKYLRIYTARGEKRKRKVRSKKWWKKNTMIEALRKMTESKNGDEKDEIRGRKWCMQGWAVTALRERCRFRREDRGICRRQPLKRLSSLSTVSCHPPFLREQCIASKFTPKIRHPLTDVTGENLIVKISNTYRRYFVFLSLKSFTRRCISRRATRWLYWTIHRTFYHRKHFYTI